MTAPVHAQRRRDGGLSAALDSWGTLLLPALAVLVAFVLPARLVVGALGAAGRPSVILGFGLAMAWLLAQLQGSGRTAPSGPLRLLLALFWASTLTSYALGFDRGMTVAEASSADRALIVAVSASGLMLAVAEGVKDRADVYRVLKTVVVGATFMAAIGLLQVFGLDLVPLIRLPGLDYNAPLIGISERGSGGFPRVAGTSGHYIEFGTVAGLALPLAVHLGRRLGGRWWVPVAALAVALPFSVSRTSFLALGLAMGVLVLAWSWRTRTNAAVVGAGVVVGFQVLQPGLLGTIKALFLGASTDPSVIGRTDDYPITSTYIAERPFFGRGPGTFIPEQYLILDNQMLGTILNTGYVGLAALLALVLGAGLAARAAARASGDPDDRELSFAVAGVVAGAVMTSLTFDSLSFALFATLLWVTVGLAFGLLRVVQSEVAPVPGLRG